MDESAALAAAEAGADAIGMIFAPSRRRVTAEMGRRITRALPPFVARVGVFVDETRERIAEIAEEAALDTIQLHGAEPPEVARSFSLPVLKTIRVRDADSLRPLDVYQVSAFLLDTYDPDLRGGTGRVFDWSLAAAVSARHHIILSGGLRPDNVTQALDQVHPYGVDVSSGVETGGTKDRGKIRAFIRRVREWEDRQRAVAGPLAGG